MADQLKITFALTAEELKKARSEMGTQRFVFVILGLAAVAVMFNFDSFKEDGIGALLPFGIYLAIVVVFMKFARRNAAVGDEKKQVEQCYFFSKNGFCVEHKLGKSDLTWDAVLQVRQSEDFYYLYVDKMLAYVLPKRAFSDEQKKVLEKILKGRGFLQSESN